MNAANPALSRLLLSAMAALAVACGTEPEPRLRITGQVTSAATGSGIPGARVELWFGFPYQSPFMLQATSTDGAGAFSLDIGPPGGYSAPNCSTLHLEVTAAGFVPNPQVGIGPFDSPECRAGAVTLTVSLTPAT
jgi:hypothetical protein